MVIFHCYVSLPEGNTVHDLQSPTRQPVTCHVSLWISCWSSHRKFRRFKTWLLWTCWACFKNGKAIPRFKTSSSHLFHGHQIHAESIRSPFCSLTTPLFGFGRWLVGGWPTPLKNMKVSWDDDIPNIWKNKKWSKPPTRWGTFLIPRDVYHSSNLNIQFGGLMIVTDTHVRLSEHSPQNQTFAHAHIISRFCHGFIIIVLSFKSTGIPSIGPSFLPLVP